MLSERYRPKAWSEFVGQAVIDEIEEACGDSWPFEGCGDFAIERIDSRAATIADFRALESTMRMFGWAGNGRRCSRLALARLDAGTNRRRIDRTQRAHKNRQVGRLDTSVRSAHSGPAQLTCGQVNLSNKVT